MRVQLGSVQDLADMLGQRDACKPSPIARPIQARVMKDMLEIVTRPNPFKPGDLVEQTKEYVAYQHPAVGEVVMVTSLIDQQLGHNAQRGHITPREDILVLINHRDRWVETAVESWRFKLYAGEIE